MKVQAGVQKISCDVKMYLSDLISQNQRNNLKINSNYNLVKSKNYLILIYIQCIVSGLVQVRKAIQSGVKVL
jgi:hypothetical protein